MVPIAVEEPTVRMTFGVNKSPLAGREGKFLTTRMIRDRLMKELDRNVALRVEETGSSDVYEVRRTMPGGHGWGVVTVSVFHGIPPVVVIQVFLFSCALPGVTYFGSVRERRSVFFCLNDNIRVDLTLGHRTRGMLYFGL